MAWATSPLWDPGWRAGGLFVCRAEVWKGGALQTLPDGSTSLRVTGGSVSVDESRKVRRQLSMTIANTDLDPVTASDLLAPIATDVRAYVGLTYTDGSTELAPAGVFRIAAPTRPSVFAPLTIAGDDYSAVLAGDRFLAPWVTAAGTLVTSEIKAMAQASVPGLTVVDLTGSRAVTAAATWERDRWDAMLVLAQSIGAELYFDAAGALIIRRIVTTPGTPVWSCDAGSSTANMLDVAVGLSSDGLYNAVVATSAPAGRPPVTVIVYQQSGPLAWVAGFRRPRFWTTPLPITTDQLYAAGAGILAQSTALSRQMDPASVPNPALEAGDSITVKTLTTSETRILSRFTVPLAPGPMPLATRVGVDAGASFSAGTLA